MNSIYVRKFSLTGGYLATQIVAKVHFSDSFSGSFYDSCVAGRELGRYIKEPQPLQITGFLVSRSL